MAETVRIDPKTHAKLAALARAKRLPLTEVVARAVDAYDRSVQLAQFNADYAAMRVDPKAWQLESDERDAWDNTNLDNLNDGDEEEEPAKVG